MRTVHDTIQEVIEDLPLNAVTRRQEDAQLNHCVWRQLARHLRVEAVSKFAFVFSTAHVNNF